MVDVDEKTMQKIQNSEVLTENWTFFAIETYLLFSFEIAKSCLVWFKIV